MAEIEQTQQPLTPDAPAGERLPAIIRRLREAHPDAHCALDYETPLQLLIATILSAQCTDERVNQVTPALFARYPDAAAFAAADRADLEALLQLTGVARKTANVVLGEIFGITEGIVVDTHVKRLSRRLGLTEESSADKIEQDLMALVPRDNWIEIGHLFIFHGRRVCHARTPACAACTLADLCPSALV